MPRNANHVTDHNELRDLIGAELARFGLPNTLGGPWSVGDPDHLGRHNAMIDALAAIATAAGKTYTAPLPPHRGLGDMGHIGDHDGMRAAAVEAATWPAWNSATGGTVTEYTDGDGRWRAHLFASAGDFVVIQGAQAFQIVGGGGGGGGGGSFGADNFAGGNGGTGVGKTDSVTLTPGTYPVVIGGGGAGGGPQGYEYGGQGGTTSLGAAFTTPGGGGGQGTGRSAPGATGSPNGPQVTNAYSGTSQSYSGGGGGGRPAGQGNDGNGYGGGPGALCVRYRIG